MALDLNKPTGGGKKPLNLDKGGAERVSTPILDPTADKGGRKWMWGLAAVLLAGVAGAYMWLQKSTPEQVASTATTDSAAVAAIPTVAEVTPAVASAADQPSSPEAAPTQVQASELVGKSFASFSAGNTTPQGVEQALVDKLKAYLELNPEAKVTVCGYASSEGSQQLNARISQQRADAFMQVLVTNGIAADRLQAVGQGIADPVADNGTESGRSANRRVAILLP